MTILFNFINLKPHGNIKIPRDISYREVIFINKIQNEFAVADL